MDEERYTIELDCWPGPTRPGDLLPGVLKGTGVEIDPNETTSRVFGNWEWEVPVDQVEAFKAARETIASRIKELHEYDSIRYGSW